jgi:MinD-like ATPase involved in chromosome partitioning or flagellar assembly
MTRNEKLERSKELRDKFGYVFNENDTKGNVSASERSGTIIVFEAEKGGTSKTTTCANLGIHEYLRDKSVLFIDFDKEKNLTKKLLVDETFTGVSNVSMLISYAVNNPETVSALPAYSLIGGVVHEKIIDYSAKTNNSCGAKFDILAGHINFQKEFDSAITNFGEGIVVRAIKNIVQMFRKQYDVILFDTPAAGENNILCDLLACIADDLIFTIDGISASLGCLKCIGRLHGKAFNRIGAFSHGVAGKKPCVHLIMSKYAVTKVEFQRRFDSCLHMGMESMVINKEAVNGSHAIFLSVFHHNKLDGVMCKRAIKFLSGIGDSLYDEFNGIAESKPNHVSPALDELSIVIDKNITPSLFDNYSEEMISDIKTKLERLAKIAGLGK